jgi:hypothetical protein
VRYLALLWVGIFGFDLGVKSGSRLAVEGRDGARYWKCFEVLLGALGVIEEMKSPCGGRGLVG